MSIFHANSLVGAAGAAGAAEYRIQRSVRFNSADSAYLSRTPGSAGNRKTWTWAGWFKKVQVSGSYWDWLFDTSVNCGFNLNYDPNYANSQFSFYDNGSAVEVKYSGSFRDPSAWYHIQLVYDSTQATNTERVRVYVNSSRLNVASATWPALNADSSFNNNIAHSIGRWTFGSSRYLNGYLADVHFIDGQALDPTSFGEFDDNGVWQPKAYTGTYGTNGFHLPFSDNSTDAALGTDTSGNSNTWTVNNISVAAGSGNDSLVDTPTNYGTDTGAGGEVRGNYCTWNPLDSGTTEVITNGNLDVKTNTYGTYTSTRASFGVLSGKWYWEVTCNAPSPTASDQIGIGNGSAPINNYFVSSSNGYGYQQSSGQKWTNDAGSAYGASYTTNDVIGVALDMDAGTLVFYKNGSSQGTAFSSLSGTFFPMIFIRDTTGSYSANFGQRPFAYTAPSGYKALCTTNLPEPTIADGSTAMDVVTYTGNGSTQTISGLGFSPDLVWLKGRTYSGNHGLYDTVRGVSKQLVSNDTAAETTNPGVFAFNSDGFDVGPAFSQSSNAWVAWTWDAGSSTVTNTDGSITSQVRANPSAGFSIISFTYPSSGAFTVGHGLNIPPSLIITKHKDRSSDWAVYHASLGKDYWLRMGTTAAATNQSSFWGTSGVSSNTFGGSIGVSGISADQDIAYCFAPVAGYSSFGSYTGNGSADGPFVYTGFRPRWVMTKQTNTTSNWVIWDAARNEYNVMGKQIYPNLSISESDAGTNPSFAILDFVANGIKIRGSHLSFNTNGGTYIYAAFAENPFKTARAR